MKLAELFDDADFCEECGGRLPINDYHGRRKFCGVACSSANYNRLDSDARREARAGRTCILCEGVITPDRTAQAIYCETCAVNRTCKHCGKVFEARFVGRVYCSRRCKFDARAAAAGRLPRPCVTCGTIYKPGSRTSRFCSQECVRWCSRANSATRGRHHQVR